MKRFLIFFVLIVFVTASCAGPRKAGWVKPDFRQGEFDEDREECKQRIGNHDLEPELFGERLERCLAEKDYKYIPLQAEIESPEQTSSDLKQGSAILDHPLAPVIQIPLAVATLPVMAILFYTYGILGKDNRAFMW